MYDWFIKGGWCMYPIAFFSVVGLAVFLERLFSLSRSRVISPLFVGRIEALVGEGRTNDALLVCQETNSPMARIMAAVLQRVGRSRERIKEAVEDVGRFEGAHLERYVEVVGTVAAIEPLLGLLGTIFGMITVFQRVEVAGLGDPAVFASGIWEALITTAAGLCVGIPAFLFYKYLQARVDRLVLEMEARAVRLLDLVNQE